MTATFVPVFLHTPLKTTPWVGEGKSDGSGRVRTGRVRGMDVRIGYGFHRGIGSENAGPHLHALA